ncbi:MAG: hypothetical protein ABWW69_02025 [Pyrodictiaceae archaeon]
MDEEALSILDHYLGDLLEKIVYEYRYNVDLEDEYEQLLKYIYRRLVRAWFDGKEPPIDMLEEKLKRARRSRKQLEILLSYLVSRFAARHGRVYLSTHDWHEEHY